MCPIIRSDGLPLRRDVCSYCGGPAGLHRHPAKSSGSKGIWWKTSSSKPGLRGPNRKTQIHTCILKCVCTDADIHTETSSCSPDSWGQTGKHTYILKCVLEHTHTHTHRPTHKSLAQNGCNLAPGEPARRPQPLLSLPSGSSGASC